MRGYKTLCLDYPEPPRLPKIAKHATIAKRVMLLSKAQRFCYSTKDAIGLLLR